MQQDVEHSKRFHGLRVSCNGPQLPWLPVPTLAAQHFSEMFLDFYETIRRAVTRRTTRSAAQTSPKLSLGDLEKWDADF